LRDNDRALVDQAATIALGAGTRVEILFDHAPARGMDTLSADRVRQREQRVRAALKKARGHPRVNDAIEVFGARIKDLRLSES
jgi:hypothetical protein